MRSRRLRLRTVGTAIIASSLIAQRSLHAHVAAVAGEQTDDEGDRRGLACPVGAEQAEQLAPTHAGGRQHDVGRVVGGQVRAQLPHPFGQQLMIVIADVKICEKVERSPRLLLRGHTGGDPPSQDCHDLNGEHFGCVERDIWVGDSLSDLRAQRKVQH